MRIGDKGVADNKEKKMTKMVYLVSSNESKVKLAEVCAFASLNAALDDLIDRVKDLAEGYDDFTHQETLRKLKRLRTGEKKAKSLAPLIVGHFKIYEMEVLGASS